MYFIHELCINLDPSLNIQAKELDVQYTCVGRIIRALYIKVLSYFLHFPHCFDHVQRTHKVPIQIIFSNFLFSLCCPCPTANFPHVNLCGL